MSNGCGLRDLTSEDLERVALLAHISTMFNASYEVEEVMARVMQVVVDTLSAERGFIMLDHGGGKVEVAAAAGVAVQEVIDGTFRYSSTVVERVLHEATPVLSHDAIEDFASSQSLKSLQTRSIMCVPISTRERTFGLIYVDNQTVAGLFVPTDLDLLKIIADLAGAAIERAHYFANMLDQEKLATLGTFVSGIVHELNGPLSGILGMAELARVQIDDPVALGEHVGLIVSEADRCMRLIQQMLSLSRREKRERCPVHLSAVIDRVRRIVDADFQRAGADLKTTVGDGLPPIHADEDQMIQLLINLITNARLAAANVPSPCVEVCIGIHEDRRRGARMRIEVQDNGSGIAPDDLHRIFDPFYTTRSAGQGTGLGLSIVSRIVSDHRGAVWAQNARSTGALFTVELPITAG